jgi:hypothetical protein
MCVDSILDLLNELNKNIMPASTEHNITSTLFNELNKFSDEPTQM